MDEKSARVSGLTPGYTSYTEYQKCCCNDIADHCRIIILITGNIDCIRNIADTNDGLINGAMVIERETCS